MLLFLAVVMVLIRDPQVLPMKRKNIHQGKTHGPFPQHPGLCRMGTLGRRQGGSPVGEVGVVFYIEGAPGCLEACGQVNTLNSDRHS